MDFNNSNIASRLNFQVVGLKVKVTVAVFRKNCHRSSPCIYQWILMYNHTIVGYYNISSNFQVAGLKIKVTLVIFR